MRKIILFAALLLGIAGLILAETSYGWGGGGGFGGGGGRSGGGSRPPGGGGSGGGTGGGGKGPGGGPGTAGPRDPGEDKELNKDFIFEVKDPSALDNHREAVASVLLQDD